MTCVPSSLLVGAALIWAVAASFTMLPAFTAQPKASAAVQLAPKMATAIATQIVPGAVQGDAAAGLRLYQSCTGCHSLDANEIGPKHRGIVGRLAGSVPGFAYSSALQSSGIVWTPQNIDRWLTDPQKLVPGTKMFFSVANPKDRADIIAYLAQQR